MGNHLFPPGLPRPVALLHPTQTLPQTTNLALSQHRNHFMVYGIFVRGNQLKYLELLYHWCVWTVLPQKIQTEVFREMELFG